MWRTMILMLIAVSCTDGASADAPKTGYYGFVDGNALLSACRQSSPFCIGYIFGAMDAFAAGRATGQWHAEIDYCGPKHVADGQVKDIIVQYLEGIPKSRHKLAAELVIYALSETWPCK